MDANEIKLAILNGIAVEEYGELVTRRIRRRYSVSDELAILRQRDTKPEAFAEYNTYVEECKRQAKEELGI